MDAKTPLELFSFERRELKEKDILIEILYCGVCHSDIHQARNEWGIAFYPLVPGHEIVGKVAQVGSAVKKFKSGDFAGVGCLVDSCRTCGSCHEGLEQFCEKGASFTYGSYEQDGITPTFGGYSNCIVVSEDFALQISPKLDLSRVAPLLCAGITTYSPLKAWAAGPGQKVGVVGLGGLGHMVLKFAHAFGADVFVFTTSPSKRQDAINLGAKETIISTEPEQMSEHLNSFDFILDTVSAEHNIDDYLMLLKRDGVMVMVGIPEKPLNVNIGSLIIPRRKLAGSLIGGLPETQEMLDFCAKHNILSDIELIPIEKINEAYSRMLKGHVKYRFVIDMASLS